MRREAKQEMIVTSPKCVLIHIYTQEMEYAIRSRSKHTLQSFRELAWYHGVYTCHLVDLKVGSCPINDKTVQFLFLSYSV